ncbi:MAG: ABC transporter ATP-binding protein [Phycisphaerae bacterium]
MSVLEVSELYKSFADVRAVDGVTFEIEAGEIFGLLGPNGAGKSTTINMIATLLVPDRGAVTINGIGLSQSAAYKRRIGYVPQEISLSDKLTARENLSLIGRLYDLSGAWLRARVGEMLEAVGLTDRADDCVGTFSGGMKRRLNIACGLLHEPELVLMDEPTAGVDPQARAYIFETVQRLAKSGRAILYTTHYMEEAQRLCRRTAIIDHGRILALGTLPELIQVVNAQRELVIRAENMTKDRISRLADRLGAAWQLNEQEARLNVSNSDHTLFDAVRAADETGLHPSSITIREPNLETVFLELTGRALRD